jgi:DNA-binding response OmpR family regulator
MILLVDADPETRKLAAFMLGKQGYTVLEARNRVEALALFDGRDRDVELLLLEAKGRGWELAEELKRFQPQARVLFMCDDSARGAQFVVAHGCPFLKKPFTMGGIASKVRDILDIPSEKTMTAGGSF